MREPDHDIPTSWRWASVGELVTLKSGFTIPTDLELAEGDIPFLRIGDMNLPANQDEITTSSRFAARTDAIEGQIIPPNSIVFPKRGGAIATNKKRFVTRPILADSNVMAMICPAGLSLEYLSTWLWTIDLAVLNSGTSVPQINNKDVAPLPVPVPSAVRAKADRVEGDRAAVAVRRLGSQADAGRVRQHPGARRTL